MTLIIGLVCKNGVAIGADKLETLFRATYLKRPTRKIYEFNLGDERKLLVAIAGTRQDGERAVIRINPEGLRLPKDYSFNEYLGDVVEPTLSRFYSSLKEKRGREPNYSLILGAIDVDGDPKLAIVYPDGSYDLETRSVLGVAAPLAEMVLRDIRTEDLDLKIVRYLIGLIIAKVSLVHQEVDGLMYGMDIASIAEDRPGEVQWLGEEEFNRIIKLTGEVSFNIIAEMIKKKITEIEEK